MTIEHIEQKLGKKLPESYKRLLSRFEDYGYINYNEFKEEFPDDDGVLWFFWGERRLDEASPIDGSSKVRRAWEVLKSFDEIRKSPEHARQSTFAEHIDSLVSIAEDNGDILYMDAADDFSVWVYMHDSGETKKLEASFDEWLANASMS